MHYLHLSVYYLFSTAAILLALVSGLGMAVYISDLIIFHRSATFASEVELKSTGHSVAIVVIATLVCYAIAFLAQAIGGGINAH